MQQNAPDFCWLIFLHFFVGKVCHFWLYKPTMHNSYTTKNLWNFTSCFSTHFFVDNLCSFLTKYAGKFPFKLAQLLYLSILTGYQLKKMPFFQEIVFSPCKKFIFPIGVRLLASLFVQYSLGVTKSVYELISDEPWSHSCAGIFDRRMREKQIFAAFSTFLPYIEEGNGVTFLFWVAFDRKFIDDCVFGYLRFKINYLLLEINNNALGLCR